ncbi:hypothetical protein HaLaN_11768, partial [Haematococcus lacustris]
QCEQAAWPGRGCYSIHCWTVGDSSYRCSHQASCCLAVARLLTGPVYQTVNQPRTGRWSTSSSRGGRLEKDMAEVTMERRGRAKQLVVLFGVASIGTGGGWGADAVLRACCKVVCRPRGPDQLRGRVVLVDEHRSTRVSSAVNGKQPCEEELDHEQPTRRAHWKPPAGQVNLRILRPAWSQQRDQPVRGLMWCPVMVTRKPAQAPCSSQEATLAAASKPALPLQSSAACAPRLSRQLSPPSPPRLSRQLS